MIEINNLSYRYGRRSTDGIQGINLKLAKNSITALIGPSGAGKTTLLKCMSKDIKDFTGEIKISDKESLGFLKNEAITKTDQSLFDYLSQSLDAQMSEEKKINHIRTLLSQLELTNEINSEISNLSSGQKQRALIAKSLVHNPTILLLDEPFANLDNNLRDILLNDLFNLLKEKEITMVWVTHNTEEALKYADQIALLQFGQLEQFDSPKNLYYRPYNIFVAQFFGTNNILSAKISKRTDKEFTINILDHNFQVPAQKEITYDDILVMVRPEFIKLTNEDGLRAEVKDVLFTGAYSSVHLNYQGQVIFTEVLSTEAPQVGDHVQFRLSTDHLHPLFT